MKTTILISVLFFARIASAQVFISEIMYDPKNGDTGHEWVEVVNQGDVSVDLARSKFVEGGSSHGLSVVQGDINLASGAYAIIADNAQTFLTDHAGFSGTVLDSAFSLKNTGETTAFKMPDGAISDTKIYTNDMGGAGDGNSLQKVGSAWRASAPTPGVANSGNESNPIQAVSGPNVSPTVNISAFPVEPQIFADAGASVRTVSSGAPIVLTGRVLGLKKEPIENARMVWSFGDGGRGEGVSVAHTYYYPGDYTAVLDVASGYYSASDRITVRVSAPLIALSVGGDYTRSFIALENHGVDEIDLSDWQVTTNGKIFTLPKNTILPAHKTLTLASEVTGLVTPLGSVVELLFPNGSHVSLESVVKAKEELIASETTSRKVLEEPKIKATTVMQSASVAPLHQKASVLDSLPDTQTSLPLQKEDGLWRWYIGAAFLGVFALLGIRLARGLEDKASVSVDDFEIIEEVEDNEPH